MPSKTDKCISSHETCDQCNKKFYIGDLLICTSCKKIVCVDCKLYLARKTEEVNFNYHYCGPKGDAQVN